MAAANARNSKNRTIAIVLGVVLGLLAIALLAGLLYFCLRRRRRQRAVGSRRSVSPEKVGGASWGKEPLSNASTIEHSTPSRFSTHERHHTPVGAATPFMAENALHRRDGNRPLSTGTPIPHRGAPDFRPGLLDGPSAGHGPQYPSQTHIPLSSHSRTNTAVAGLGGAALGGMAAKHHHDKHDQRDSTHYANDQRQNISRKPIGGGIRHGTSDQSSNVGVMNDSAPGYQTGHSGSPIGNMKNSSERVGTTGGIPPSLSPGNGNPPAYNGTGNPLSSHPPFADSHRHSAGHDPLMAGAAGVGAGALGGAALAKHDDGNRDADSALTGRRSWDPSRPPRNPQSILANAANRRSTGSTNPYVQARSPGRRARFSDDVTDLDSSPHDGNGHHDEIPQNHSYPHMEHSRSPQQVRPNSGEYVRNESPSHMPGGWRGSGEFSRIPNRSSFSNDNPTLTPTQSAELHKSKNPSLSDLRQQEEDGWYRGRYMGDDVRPMDSGTSPVGGDQRFYANRSGVGQAM
jgi:hypothetical protein